MLLMVPCLPGSWSHWKLVMLIFEEGGGGNWSTQRKTSWSKGENQQQTQPTLCCKCWD